MPPTHAKKPAAMKEKCAHGGPLQCNAGCYSKGGSIEDAHEKQSGINLPVHSGTGNAGTSQAGIYARAAHNAKRNYPGGTPQGEKDRITARGMHGDTLHEMRADKTDRRNLADGGDVEPLDGPMQDDDHEELESTLAGELLHAMEKKDKKGVAEAIEALVLQCMNKGGM